MSRLRQYFANRYGSSEATSAEFENIIRYLNSAEVGNHTIGELMEKLFDEDGNLDIGVEIRFNPATGLEYRTDPSVDEWTLISPSENIRGVAGQNVGTIEAPLFSNRQDFVATAGQTNYSYTPTASASNIVVWINGILQPMNSYSYASGVVTLASGQTVGTKVTMATVRSNPASSFRRVDLTAASAQVTFPFPHTSTEEIQVFRNGILLREGGGYDFIRSPELGTVTMTTATTAGDVITIICITNSAIRDVAGIMLEDEYSSNGLIRLDRVNIPDGGLAQAKVAGLVSALANRAKISVGPTQPATPGMGDLWVNTSYSVPTLLFFDGTRWLNSSPNGMIPLPQASNALHFVRLNSTATALEYAPIDTTGLVQWGSVGSANGVAALDSSGKIPKASMPDVATKSPIIGRIGGSLANGSYVVGHIDGSIHTFMALTAKLTSGTATLQLSVGGTNIGSTLAATSTTQKLAITAAAVDATASPKDVVLTISGAASPVDLSYNISTNITG